MYPEDVKDKEEQIRTKAPGISLLFRKTHIYILPFSLSGNYNI